ncbi:MAG: ABC transporter permease [Candidatus Kapabacteria bacterium]|nr:ABC transporter permease [Candidatus Kapabacteria bacterium]MDW8225826.1 ABC transporter permease [Bacteroidota bacterium]
MITLLVYIGRKLAVAVGIIGGVITVTFFLNFVLPGDPARLLAGQRADAATIIAIRQQLGLDQPLPVQYVRFLSRVVQGDLGRSYVTNRPVLEILIERFPATALLTVTSMAIATVLGIVMGLAAALRPNSWVDTFLMGTALVGISVPSFVAGLLLLLLFGVVLGWFPLAGYIDQGWQYLALPMLTLALRPLSIIARMTRSSMLDVLGQDYIRTARAKGVPPVQVLLRHALRNALNPVVTTVSAWFAGLLAGAFFVEYIFNWPGIGTVAISAIEKLDYPLIQGTVLFTAVVFVVVNFVVDVLYAVLDPRVQLD